MKDRSATKMCPFQKINFNYENSKNDVRSRSHIESDKGYALAPPKLILAFRLKAFAKKLVKNLLARFWLPVPGRIRLRKSFSTEARISEVLLNMRLKGK